MSWFACHRSEEMLSLLRQDPKAMNLLLLIACRARYTEDVCPVTKLGYGQAFIGDFKEAGISSRQAYRLALKRLFKSGFLTIQGTNKGTIVTLLPQAIFTISVPPKEPSKEPSRNQQGTIEEPLRTKEQGNKGTNPNPNPNPADGGRERKSSDNLPTAPESIKISELFHRRPTTKWSAKEIAAYKAIPREALEDLDLVCQYTEAERAKGQNGRHRRDLLTFLNNFTGELDRARAKPINGNGKTTSAAQYGI